MREMKDSGVEWIGKIPKDWECCKQKYKIELINGRAYKDTEFEEDGKYRILRVGNLFSNNVWYSSSLELEEDKYCEKGDLLYAWSMSYGPYIWEREKVIYHYHIWKTKLQPDLDKKFAYYYLTALSESIRAESHETTMGFVTMGIMNNSYIAYPMCIELQKRIADYLDSKCSKIDEIIAKQEQIIEKLKEYKLSVITEAVTKGLNPNVEMKDSGIEWIVKIPKHWSKAKLKYYCYIRARLGWKGLKAEEYVEEGYPLLSAFNIVNSKVDFINNINYINQERYDESPEIMLSEGDILLVKDGAGIGKCGIIETLPLASTTNGSLAVITTSEAIESKYLYYYFLSNVFQKYIDRIKDGMGVPHLFQSDLKEIEVVIPSLCEQKEIILLLDSKVQYIDAKIATIEQLIEKFQQYKKSLIYEVVTGKKEV